MPEEDPCRRLNHSSILDSGRRSGKAARGSATVHVGAPSRVGATIVIAARDTNQAGGAQAWTRARRPGCSRWPRPRPRSTAQRSDSPAARRRVLVAPRLVQGPHAHSPPLPVGTNISASFGLIRPPAARRCSHPAAGYEVWQRHPLAAAPDARPRRSDTHRRPHDTPQSKLAVHDVRFGAAPAASRSQEGRVRCMAGARVDAGPRDRRGTAVRSRDADPSAIHHPTEISSTAAASPDAARSGARPLAAAARPADARLTPHSAASTRRWPAGSSRGIRRGAGQPLRLPLTAPRRGHCPGDGGPPSPAGTTASGAGTPSLRGPGSPAADTSHLRYAVRCVAASRRGPVHSSHRTPRRGQLQRRRTGGIQDGVGTTASRRLGVLDRTISPPWRPRMRCTLASSTGGAR